MKWCNIKKDCLSDFLMHPPSQTEEPQIASAVKLNSVQGKLWYLEEKHCAMMSGSNEQVYPPQSTAVKDSSTLGQ